MFCDAIALVLGICPYKLVVVLEIDAHVVENCPMEVARTVCPGLQGGTGCVCVCLIRVALKVCLLVCVFYGPRR